MQSPVHAASVSRLHFSRISWVDVACLLAFGISLVSAFAAATGRFHG